MQISYNFKRRNHKILRKFKDIERVNGIELKPIEKYIIQNYQSFMNLDNDTLEILFNQKRTRYYAARRNLLVYCLRKYNKTTWERIADVLNKNHATIIHSYRQAEDYKLDMYGYEFGSNAMKQIDSFMTNKIKEYKDAKMD